MISIKLAKNKSMDLEENLDYLVRIRKNLINNSVIKDICNEFGFDNEVILGVPISFSNDIDVAAKTKNGNMVLNSSLIEDDFDILMRYVVHEFVHVLQHVKNKSKKDLYEGEDYLDRPDEIEAFQFQIEYDEDNRGEDEVVEYVEELVDFHEVPKKEQVSKVKELLENI